jgi:YD repeat-containing protein
MQEGLLWIPSISAAISEVVGVRSTFMKIGLGASFVLVACCSGLGQTPSISSVSPNPGGIGQSVTISGTNFGTSGSVTFSGVTASTTNWTATSITATVPVGATNGNVVVTSGGQSSNGFSFALNNGPVNYVYDDLGRLAAVIDVNGNAAEYSYDAVGNILSVSRFTSTQVSIINFSPESGPIGTAVTINGTGFSATPSLDSVTFNGVTATVSSATTSQLQVAVPSTATTGAVSVTSPNGSATSSTNFTVTSSNGVPTITSFSPTSGLATTTVTVVGTNFDPTLANNKLRLDASQATVSSVTSTTIATKIPSATASGHFSLIAPAGNAVSSQDFYVPFGTHVPGDIGFTARIVAGSSQSVTLASSQIALILFDGLEGQHVDVQMSGSTFSTCNLYLIAPDTSITAMTPCTTWYPDLGSTYLPKSGTYTIGIDPGTSSGSITVTLVSDVLGTIAIDGPAVTVATTTPGQDARLSFTATPGQRIVTYVSSVTNPYAYLNLVAPTGSIQTSLGFSNSPTGYTFFIDTQSLTAGTNQLWVQHSGTNYGSETLQIASVPPDFTATLGVPAAGATGTTVQVPTTGNLAVGQNANLTFSGTAGQQLSFNIISSTIGASTSACVFTLYDPNHSSIASGYCGTGASYVDTVTLALTGTYTIYLNPYQTATGSVGISINNAQDVTTPTISIGGAAVTATTTVAGQDVRLSFSATAGQRIVLYATSVTNPYASLILVTPSGGYQASTTIGNSPSGWTFFIDTQTLATTGTYQLWVQHSGANFGSETLQIGSVPSDFTATLTVPAAGATGTAVQVPTSGNLAVGQNASLTFSGTAGQQLSFNIISSTIGSSVSNCAFTLYDPSHTSIASSYCGTGASYVDTVTLASTGTYTVYLAPYQMATGSVGISINNAQNVTTPTISIDGGAVTATTTVPGQDVWLSFTATAGQRIVVYATSVTNPYASLILVTPTGGYQTSTTIGNSPSGWTFFIDTQTLATAGTYQLWVQHSGANIGSETLQISSVPADLSDTATIGGTAISFTTIAGQNANISFSNPLSQSVTVQWASGTYPTTPSCYITVTGPSPSTAQVGFGYCSTATGTLSLGTLSSGTYNIFVNPQAQSAGGMSLTVTTP